MGEFMEHGAAFEGEQGFGGEYSFGGENSDEIDVIVGRVRAPELGTDLEWINAVAPLSLSALRGRYVLLDFWTSC